MAEHDLTARMAEHLDYHLLLPLLEFLQERGIYADEEILEAKARFLWCTDMVDYVMEIHKSRHGTDDVLEDMAKRRDEVLSRLGALAEATDPIDSLILQNQQIGPDQIETLFQYARFLFDCGNYQHAADYLDKYHALCTNSERSLSALWGKLEAEILLQNWDVALEELNCLKEIIDSKTNAPHLLRYLATAVVVNKWRRNMLKELIKVIQQEQHSYKDPITEFLECLFVTYDFDGAQQKLIECEQVILNDPFLGKRIEEGNFITVPLRGEFLENARLFIFETYCRINRCIDIGMLSQKLNMSYDEAELWIMNLVTNSKLDAKIDSVSGTLIMTTNHVNIHEKLIESLKNLNMRTSMLTEDIVEPAQAAQQATR